MIIADNLPKRWGLVCIVWSTPEHWYKGLYLCDSVTSRVSNLALKLYHICICMFVTSNNKQFQISHITFVKTNLNVIRQRYFTVNTLKDLFKNVDSRFIIDFVKESNFYSSL